MRLFADKIIISSSFLKNKFSFLRGRNEIIFLGLDDNFLGEYNPPTFNGIKRMILPGEFREGKNQDVLMRALKKYIDKTGARNVELYLPGEGKKLGGYKRLVSILGLEGKVFFPGFLTRNQMIELYRKCQFAIVPSNVETFGLCITEPFALGRVAAYSDKVKAPGFDGKYYRGSRSTWATAVGGVWLQAIEKPQAEFKYVVDVFRQVLDHEKKVTGAINKLYELATKKNDYPTQVRLQWFINEQVEEEKSVQSIVHRLEMVGDHGASLFMLDHQMGTRGSKG